jgi:hypothetical protein
VSQSPRKGISGSRVSENIIWWKPGFREELFLDSRRIEATRLSLEEGSLKQLLSPLLTGV